MALWYAMRASGIVSLILLSTVVALGLLTAGRRTRSAYVTTALHRSLSLLAVVFVALHVTTSVTDAYVPIPWTAVLVPFTSTYEPLWVGLGTVAIDLLAALITTSLLRTHLSRRTWRTLHWTAYATWPIALTHAIGTATDDKLTLTVAAACVLAVLATATKRLPAHPRPPRTGRAPTPLGPQRTPTRTPPTPPTGMAPRFPPQRDAASPPDVRTSPARPGAAIPSPEARP